MTISSANIPHTRQDAIAAGFREHPLHKGFYANESGDVWSSRSKKLLGEASRSRSNQRITLRISHNHHVSVQRRLFASECMMSIGEGAHEMSRRPLTGIMEIDGFMLNRKSAIAVGFKEHPIHKGFYADLSGNVWSEKSRRLLGEEARVKEKQDFVIRAGSDQVRIRRDIFATECHLTTEGGPHGFKRHPIYKNLYANEEGVVWSARSKRVVRGCIVRSGYITLGITGESSNKTICAHIIVYEAFHGKVDSNTHEIDHINGCPADNRLCNLQALTKADHRRKTRKTARSSGPALRRCIMRFRIDNSGERVDVVEYESSSHAAVAMGASRGNFNKAIRTGKLHLGYYWVYVAEPDLEGEVWRELKLERSVILVSDKGRICAHNNRKTFGSINLHGYYQIRIANKSYLVHYLVCLAFNGLPINGEDTVDHINQDRACNESTNLRWATRHMQNIYRHAIPVIVRDSHGVVCNRWPSIRDACRHFGVTAARLSKVIKNGGEIQGLTPAFDST